MQNMPPLTCGVLLLAIDVFFLCHAVVADQCSGGSNIFTEIPENSPHGTLVSHLSVFGDPESNSVQLTLSGMDASWFYLDGKTVRLNASEEKVLDKEVLETPVLMVSFTCMEDGFSPVEYRIIVQVMNENDNKPRFHEDSITTQNISELAAVHSVVFSTQAEDADGDTLMYVIDSTSADARYFRIDLPNSGKIVLARTLDFETKRHLEFVVHAVEMNTKERYNSSARIRVNVLDGDDQYPQFQPCNVLSHDGTSVCVSPIYTTNITEGEIKTEPLHFLPGAIHAEDGDRDLRTPVVYSILAGTDHGYFHMDNLTGAITMLRAVESRVSTPVHSLSIMAFQVNDAKKYAVAEVRVRVLAANHQSPHFTQSQYQAFVHEDENMASLVMTYSGRVLFLNAMDMDFADGFNPMVRYSLKRQSNHTRLFQMTPGGLLIARSDHLRAFERYALQIIARDEESGETTNTTVKVEVLRFGEEVPLDPADADRQGRLDAGILAGSLGALLLVTAIVLFLILRAMKKRQRHQQNMERAALAMEKHPNVSLKWFQPVNAGKALPNPGNIYFQNEGYSDLGDELPKTYEGQTTNYKQASTRSEREVATKDTVVANSVGKFNNQGGQAKTNPAPKEQEEGIKAALLNGKTLEQMAGIPPCPEETVFSKDSQVGEVLVEAQPLIEALVEVQVVGEEDKEVLSLETSEANEEEQMENASGELEEASLQPQQPKEEEEAWSSQEGKMEANGDTSPVGSVAEGSPTDSNCLDSEGGKEHTNLTEEVNGSGTASPATSDINTTVDPEINDTVNVTATINLDVNDSLPRKDTVTPLPTLKELPKQLSEEEEEEDDEDGELTPKAMSPTYQDPLASLPVSDVRMPVTLLQLLEDSIEC